MPVLPFLTDTEENVLKMIEKTKTGANDKPVKPKKEKRNSNVSDESFRANTFDMMPDE